MPDWNMTERCFRCGSPLRLDTEFGRALAAYGMYRERYVCLGGHSVYVPPVESEVA